jgi:hypothetical protein
LVRQHYVYAVEIWGCALQSSLNDLFLKQKAAIRIISGEKYNAHTEHLFKKHEILKLPDLIDFCKIKLSYQITKCKSPSLLQHVWLTNRQRRVINLGAQDLNQVQAQVQGQDPVQVHAHNHQLDQEHNQDQNRRLRNEDDLYEPYARLDFTARLPYFSFPKLWNPLPIDCKTSLSLKILCNKLKSMYLENYLNISRCNRLFCPVCRLIREIAIQIVDPGVFELVSISK